MADTVNVTVIEDDDVARTFQITSGGTALNISSVTVFAVIKPSERVEDNAASAHTLTDGDGLTIVDAATGKVRLDYPAEVTASPGWWFYKIRVTSSAGQTETAITGWIAVSDA